MPQKLVRPQYRKRMSRIASCCSAKASNLGLSSTIHSGVAPRLGRSAAWADQSTGGGCSRVRRRSDLRQRTSGCYGTTAGPATRVKLTTSDRAVVLVQIYGSE